MKFKNQILAAAVLSLMMLTFNSCDNDNNDRTKNDRPVRHELATKQVGNDWKIVDAQDSLKTKIEVMRGDTVVWHAPINRHLYFQFMDEELTGEYTHDALPGQSLTVVIGDRAEIGEHPYAVFVYGARMFAKGESPPVMIIQN